MAKSEINIEDPRDVENKLRGVLQSVKYQASQIQRNFTEKEELDDTDVLDPARKIHRKAKAAEPWLDLLATELTRLRRELALEIISGSRPVGLDDAIIAKLIANARHYWRCEVILRHPGSIPCTESSRHHDSAQWGCGMVWESVVRDPG